jgi:iron complex outermembrane receptor protein
MKANFKFILGLTTCLMSPAIAAAQNTDDATAPQSPTAADTSPSEADAADTSGVGEILVTATRRSESLQKVPLNVIALQDEQLDALRITSTADLPVLAPGLTVVRSGGIVPFIRGVGTATSGFTTEIPVAVYLDGVYQPNASSGLFSFNNIERIEVLKGPQGTLYGRNSTGGLLNVITREPGNEVRVDASASYGNYDAVDLKFYGSTPIAENLAFNIAAAYSNQGDGYGINTFTGNDVLKAKSYGVQAKLRWSPGPDTDVTLRGLYNYNKSNFGIAFQILPDTVAADGTRPSGEYRTRTRRDPTAELDQYNVNLKLEHSLGFASLMSLTSYSKAEQPLRFTQSGNPGNPVVGQSAVENNQIGSSRSITQEFQLTSIDSGSPFRWVAGAFYFNDNTNIVNEVYSTCVGAVCAAAPVPLRTIADAKTRSYSAYGEGTYDITETTHLTLGLRYTSDRKTLSGTTEPFPGQPNTPAVLPATVVVRPGDPYPGNPAGIDTSSTFAKVTYRAVLAQDFTDDINGYISFNRGFKSGTYNTVAFNNPASRPELLDAYALGVKSRLFDRMVTLNVEGFMYDYTDIQLRSTAPPALPGTAILQNAGAAKVKGIDVDLVFSPTSNFTLNGNFEYLDAKYTSFPGGTCVSPRVIAGPVLGGYIGTTCDLSGRRLIQSPEISFNIGFNYTLETGIGDITLAANDSYKSSYVFVADGSIKNDGYHLVNASVTWTSLDEKFDVQLFGKNLTDTYYYTGGAAGVAGNQLYSAGSPRTYGVQVGVHF